MIVIIPLGGLGIRFKERGYKLPKPMINVKGKPILYHLIEHINADLIYIPYNKEIEKYNLEDMLKRDFPNKNFKFLCLKENTRGAAETIKISLDYLDCFDSPILCLDGDTFYNINIVKEWNKGNYIFCEKSHKECFSYIKVDEFVSDIKEKEVISSWACTGAYGFRSWKQLRRYCAHIIKNGITDKGEFYVSTVIREMIRDDIKFIPHFLKNNTISLGTPEDMIKYYNIGILFDLDGTLVKTDSAYIRAWRELLYPYGYVVDKEWFETNVKGMSDTTVFSNLFPDHSCVTTTPQYSILSQKKDELFHKYIDEVEEVNGAISFIKQCIKYDISCAIVTNCNRVSSIEILRKFGILGDIKIIIIGDECLKPKPYPHPYLNAIAQLNRDMYMVFEDTPTGIQSGKASGSDIIIGLETSYNSDVLQNHGANFTISDFNTDIFDILRKVENMKKEYLYLENECKRIFDTENVKIEKTFLKGGYIANIQKVIVDSKTYIIKRENESNHVFNKISKGLQLYEREFYFYESISDVVPIKVPKYYGTIYSGEYKKGIVIEYLGDEYTFGPRLTNDQLILVIKNIAEMHRRFWDSKELDEYDLQRSIDPLFAPSWNELCIKRWPMFAKKWKGVLTENQLDMGKRILNSFSNVQKNMSKPPLTLVHGDIKLPNIAISKSGEAYFLDWQYIVKGKGIQDIAFLLVESFDIKDYDYILNLYMNSLNIEYKDYMRDFKDALCYFPFYVALWFGTADDKDLIDIEFPKKYISKLFTVYEKYIN